MDVHGYDVNSEHFDRSKCPVCKAGIYVPELGCCKECHEDNAEIVFWGDALGIDARPLEDGR